MDLDEVRAIEHVSEALKCLKLTPQDKGLDVGELDLDRTPARIVRMWKELTTGLRREPPEIAVFESDHKHMLLLGGIDFVSICSHHFVPFRGVAYIAYIPEGRLLGISKPARIVDYFAASPQTQERLTTQIANYLMDVLNPKGVMVVLKAEHACTTCRGAKKPNSRFTTSWSLGLFLTDPSAKEEFFDLLNLGD